MKIILDNLVKIYNKREVVNKVSLYINEGEVVGLLGPNGAGKTTTFYMVVGLVKPNSGKVLLDDKEITRLPMYKRARMGIGYLAQEPSIFRRLTVEENLLLIWEMLNVPKKEQLEKLENMLNEFGLQRVRKQHALSLSGGERRRVEIARSLAANPHFLLLDEPFTGIDPIAIDEIQKIIIRLTQTRGIGILITDHNVRETLSITERAYIIRNGTILVQGSSKEVANDPVAIKYYLGNSLRYLDEVDEKTAIVSQ
jgi:lipopolysaccharide export system ATP-binding protein